MDWIQIADTFIKEDRLEKLDKEFTDKAHGPKRGNVKITSIKDGRPDHIVQTCNLIVTGLKQSLAHCIAGDTNTWQINGFQIGTGTTAPTVVDTTLEVTQFTKSLVVITYPTTSSVLFTLTVEKAEGNGAGSYTEAGLFSDIAVTNKLGSRVVFNPIPKDATIKLIFEWEYIF